MNNSTTEPLHGDRRDDREKGTCDFLCRIHGWITVKWHNPEILFMKEHQVCVPILVTTDDALRAMQNLAAENERVGVFWDRGWGDSGEVAEISIIVDGNGQNPRAFITPDVYNFLLLGNVIAPNSLYTFKARKFHEFVVPEAAMPS